MAGRSLRDVPGPVGGGAGQPASDGGAAAAQSREPGAGREPALRDAGGVAGTGRDDPRFRDGRGPAMAGHAAARARRAAGARQPVRPDVAIVQYGQPAGAGDGVRQLDRGRQARRFAQRPAALSRADGEPARGVSRRQVADPVCRKLRGRRRAAGGRHGEPARTARPRAGQLLGHVAGLPHRHGGQHHAAHQPAVIGRRILRRRGDRPGRPRHRRQPVRRDHHLGAVRCVLLQHRPEPQRAVAGAQQSRSDQRHQPVLRAVLYGSADLGDRGLPLQRRQGVRCAGGGGAGIQHRPGRVDGGPVADRRASLREGADRGGRRCQRLHASGRHAGAGLQSAARSPHHPAQSGAVRDEPDGRQEIRLDELHPLPGGPRTERARDPAGVATRGGSFLCRAPDADV